MHPTESRVIIVYGAKISVIFPHELLQNDSRLIDILTNATNAWNTCVEHVNLTYRYEVDSTIITIIILVCDKKSQNNLLVAINENDNELQKKFIHTFSNDRKIVNVTIIVRKVDMDDYQITTTKMVMEINSRVTKKDTLIYLIISCMGCCICAFLTAAVAIIGKSSEPKSAKQHPANSSKISDINSLSILQKTKNYPRPGPKMTHEGEVIQVKERRENKTNLATAYTWDTGRGNAGATEDAGGTDEEGYDNGNGAQKMGHGNGGQVVNDEMESEVQIMRLWTSDTVCLPQNYQRFLQNGYKTLDIIKEIRDREELADIGINCMEHQDQILTELVS